MYNRNKLYNNILSIARWCFFKNFVLYSTFHKFVGYVYTLFPETLQNANGKRKSTLHISGVLF